MKLPRSALALLLTFVLTLLGACGGPTLVVEQYSGPRRDPSTIAVLRFLGSGDTRLVTLDGERADVPLEDDSRLHVEMLPGEHRVGVVHADRLQAPLQYVSFRAEPGKVYRVVFPNGASSAARVHEVDRSSDALLRDVTLADQPEAPPPVALPPPPAPPAPASEPAPSELDLAPVEPAAPAPPSAVDGGAAPPAPDAD